MSGLLERVDVVKKELLETDEKMVALTALTLATPGLISDDVFYYCRNIQIAENMLRPAGHGGKFTWDGEENAITKSPLWPNSFTWIDYVLHVNGSASALPLLFDNRAIRLASRVAFPELSLGYMKKCGAKATGIRQSALITSQRCGSASSSLKLNCDTSGRGDSHSSYAKLIQRLKKSVNAPETMTDEELLGADLFEQFRKKEGAEYNDALINLMDPMLSPLFTEVSDHYAVLSRVAFGDAVWKETKVKPPVEKTPSLKRPSQFCADTCAPHAKSAEPEEAEPDDVDMETFTGVSTAERENKQRDFYFRDVSRTMAATLPRRPPVPFVIPYSVKIMTQNLHFRPYFMVEYPVRAKNALLRPAETALEHTDTHCGTFAAKKYTMSEHLAMNMQEFRARVFVHALNDLATTDELPDFLCLQETQHDAANAILTSGLKKLYRFNTTSRTALAWPGKGEAGGMTTWGGLQLWSNWIHIDSQFIRFSRSVVTEVLGIQNIVAPISAAVSAGVQSFRSWFGAAPRTPTHAAPEYAESSGADFLSVNKGMLWVLLENPTTRYRLQIIILHPSPYVDVLKGVTKSRPAQVARVHRKQINMVREFVTTLSKDTDLENVPLFITGDLNINMYGVEPDSAAEKDPIAAATGISHEFAEVVRKLNIYMPDFVPDDNKSRWVPKNRLASAVRIEQLLNDLQKLSPGERETLYAIKQEEFRKLLKQEASVANKAKMQAQTQAQTSHDRNRMTTRTRVGKWP